MNEQNSAQERLWATLGEMKGHLQFLVSNSQEQNRRILAVEEAQVAAAASVDTRLTKVERFQYKIVGAIAFIVTVFPIAAAIAAYLKG